MKIFLRTIFCLFLVSVFSTVHARHRFEIRDGHFWYDGKPIQIHSGEMHYARVPRAYWRQRLQMLKAMGLNTVATYVFWNYHNTVPGVWDFTTGNRNLAEFIRIAGELGLFVILRPGPYACAEWEFGGYPWWLQKDSALVIRTYNRPFLDSCKNYMNRLAAEVKPLLVTHGGPVIMVQVENEFGSYAAQRKDIPIEQHRKYNNAIKQLLVDAGFDVPFFTSDGSWLFEGGHLDGVLPTANGEANIGNLKNRVNRFHNNEGPYMVAEYYPGWLHHWGEPFPHVSSEEVVSQLEKYLQNGISFNIYVVHGGTNFGFTSGANYDEKHDIQPDLTSYDYDAPISEAGWATPKYLAIRELMKKYVPGPLPEIPAPIPVTHLPPIRMEQSSDFFEIKKEVKPVRSDTVLSFEALNQGCGYVLYSRRFSQAAKGQLRIQGLRDYALIYVNGERVGILDRMQKKYSMQIDIPAGAILEIFVENLGRINYGAEINHNNKGLIAPVEINEKAINGDWEMFCFPFASVPAMGTSPAQSGRPALYKGSFDVDTLGDVFLDMRSWGKGIVFVNGKNLGRYWRIGPQQTLYLPGAFLRKGKNEIVVFEEWNENIGPLLKTAQQPILTELTIGNEKP